MKRLLRIFAWLMAASMLIWMVGCGGDDDDDDDNDNDAGPVPEVLSTSPTEGGEQGGNVKVVFTLNKALDPAATTVTGASGTTAVVGTTVEFTPDPAIPVGSVTLTLTGADVGGQTVTHTLTFNALEVDEDPPVLVGASCVPADGADGVDPAGITELVIKFNEALGSATVTAKDPTFNSTDTVAGDTLTITFLAYTLPNETPVSISITAVDGAGNSADVTYGFETMMKAQ
jgi:hypothetical protein